MSESTSNPPEKVTPLGKLSPRRERFCQEYLRDLNPGKAYKRAGYAGKGASASASALLSNPAIAAYIQALKDERSHRTKITLDAVVAELALLALSNALDYATPQSDGSAIVDLSELTREQAAAITEISTETYADGAGDDAREVKRVKFKLADKRAALELLGRHLGGFPTKHEHAGVGGVPIQTLGVHVELTATERTQRVLQLMRKGIELAAEASDEKPAEVP